MFDCLNYKYNSYYLAFLDSFTLEVFDSDRFLSFIHIVTFWEGYEISLNPIP